METFTLAQNAHAMLLKIGQQLDRDIFPHALDGGIVTPNESDVPKLTWANMKENDYAEQGQRRSETRTRPRTTRRQGTTTGDRTSNQATPLVFPDLKAKYESELPEALMAYPNTQVWPQKEGLWLLCESTLLDGLREKAVFLVGIPFARNRIVRAWGFWTGPPLAHPTWIGPRHTNFGDGSICAFEPSDGTWGVDDSIRTLLDIYTLWALRHLHLRVFDRWPGRQVAHLPYERFLELRCDELCGCGSDKVYGECCQPKDLLRDKFSDASDFFDRTGSKRTPPDAVNVFMRSSSTPPSIDELLPLYKITIRKNVLGVRVNPIGLALSHT